MRSRFEVRTRESEGCGDGACLRGVLARFFGKAKICHCECLSGATTRRDRLIFLPLFRVDFLNWLHGRRWLRQSWSIRNGDTSLHAAKAIRPSAGVHLDAAGTRGCAARLLCCCCLLPALAWTWWTPAVSSMIVLHLFGTVLATPFMPAVAAWLGVFVRAEMRALVCAMPCVVPAQRIALVSTASQRHRVIICAKSV